MVLKWNNIYPGVWNFQTGEPKVTLTGVAGRKPSSHLIQLDEMECPENLTCEAFGKYTVIRIPLTDEDRVFGGGLMFQKVITDNQVYHLRVDHFAGMEVGNSHAPVPFVAVSNGVGLLCNTPEKVDLYIRTAHRKEDKEKIIEHDRASDGNWSCYNPPYFIEISVESSDVEFVLFHGKNVKDCVARFNLFCGGGFIPPKWGFGLWHRTNMTMNEKDVQDVVEDYKKHDFPLSVIGLEPGWQSGAYPCTYDWSEKNFPNAEKMIRNFLKEGIRVNLWENPCISERSSVYEKLYPYAGSHLQWCGIVPDYTLPEVRTILKEHHKNVHFAKGVSGYKLDESDGYDKWLWPDHAQFPSGLRGFVFRNLCGLLFQRITYELYHEQDQRTYGLTRSTNAGGVGFPYVLYNDRYDFKEFVTGLCSCGFTGALWCPEVRGAKTASEWIRRFQLLAISPMLLLNAWANYATPWMFPEAEETIRATVKLRESLLPYFYTAFAKYHFEGIPPYRPLFMDYGLFLNGNKAVQGELDDTSNPYQEVQTTDIKDQFIVGESLMAAPLEPETTSRKVIFPPGRWFDFHTGKQVVENGGVVEIFCGEHEPMPLFAPDGAIVPVKVDGSLQVKKFGTKPGKYMLYDDDGETFAYERGKYIWKELLA